MVMMPKIDCSVCSEQRQVCILHGQLESAQQWQQATGCIASTVGTHTMLVLRTATDAYRCIERQTPTCKTPELLVHSQEMMSTK